MSVGVIFFCKNLFSIFTSINITLKPNVTGDNKINCYKATG